VRGAAAAANAAADSITSGASTGFEPKYGGATGGSNVLRCASVGSNYDF
jgi:hypothetical protein